jgi:hypothetical protein
VPGAVRDAEAFLSAHETTLERFERVVRLVEGFETPFGLELLATVHWVVTKEGAGDLTDVAVRVHGWNQRKRQFSLVQIDLAATRLREQRWI